MEHYTTFNSPIHLRVNQALVGAMAAIALLLLLTLPPANAKAGDRGEFPEHRRPGTAPGLVETGG